MTSADPYRNLRFRVLWDGLRVAGFGALSPQEPSPRTSYDAVTLERGVTHDADFERWAAKVWPTKPSEEAQRDLRIEVHDEACRLIAAYRLLRAWVSEYQALPDLDANANAVAIEHLKLEHEGFERDDNVPDPDEHRTPCGKTRMWRFRPFANRNLNRFMLPLAARLPGFAVLTHRGRRTGRSYRTPVNVFRRGDDYVFFLTYGSDVQWVKNVLTGGSCSIESRGRIVDLADPELVTDPDLRPAPPHVRLIERRLAGVTQYLRMRAASPTS